MKKLFVPLGGVAAAAAVFTILSAGGAAGGPTPITATPEREAPQLGCGLAPTMVIHTGLYQPGTSADPARSPAEALERIVGRHYPNAPRALFRNVQQDAEGSVKYHVRHDREQLLASFLVSAADGEYWVEEIALCEKTAKGWAR